MRKRETLTLIFSLYICCILLCSASMHDIYHCTWLSRVGVQFQWATWRRCERATSPRCCSASQMSSQLTVASRWSSAVAGATWTWWLSQQRKHSPGSAAWGSWLRTWRTWGSERNLTSILYSVLSVIEICQFLLCQGPRGWLRLNFWLVHGIRGPRTSKPNVIAIWPETM